MKFEVSPSVVSRQVGEETMLMDLQSGTYFGLDPIGARVWQAIENGEDCTTLGAMLAGEYDAPAEQIDSDIAALLDKLSEQKLIVQASE